MKRFLLYLLIVITVVSFSCKKSDKNVSFTLPVESYRLSNGLTVVLNEDPSDPIVAVAIHYHVGSSREVPGKTGFAHLFEHMMFQRSENVGEDQLFKMIMEAGGELNGGTGEDQTIYYEVVPKNALERVLWLESDRLGYLENTVTASAFINQQNVVQNEKRQSVDNVPYGFNESLILKNIFPKGHPYSWEVIGEMEDLTNATVEDVKSFHRRFYTPNNATLVLSGDINMEEIKPLIEKYFGEIPAGENVEKRSPMPATVETTMRLYHEDNLARAPRLTMVFPAVEQFTKESYALDYLGDLLSDGKKTPLYKILVRDKQLTSSVSAYNYSLELAGTFRITVTANAGVDLDSVENAIFEAFEMFERDGFTEEDLARIKARNETGFFNNFSSTLYKAFMLGQYQMFKDDPSYYSKDFSEAQSVTMEDVKAVYQKYIKGKSFIETSFVPKGEVSLIVENSTNAEIVEEDVTNAAEIKESAVAEEPIAKTPTAFDRSVAPALGPDPVVTIPPVWEGSLSNGMKISGIVQKELPLVQYALVIEGGHLLDTKDKSGVANLTAALMNEGTKNKTPEELEDAIGLLGANISITAGTENITVEVSTLSRNFSKTIDLVEEMLLEPRWDEEQFALAKSRTTNTIKRNAANPDFLSSSTLNKLIFGENILADEITGTEVSVDGITINDLKDYYDRNFSPSVSRFIIAGNIDEPEVEAALAGLNEKWKSKDVIIPDIRIPEAPKESKIYFVDVPGATQSAINIGCPSIPRTNPDYYPAFVANYRLGAREASLSGIWMQIIREEKGFTYGAYSAFSGYKNYGYFSAWTKVRTNATLETIMIFKREMEKYREEIPSEYIESTRSGMMKSNARRFETLGSLLRMINTMSAYNLPPDYIKQEEAYLLNLTPEKQLEVVKKYIDPARMYFVIAGDARTQLKLLEKAGLGKPLLIN